MKPTERRHPEDLGTWLAQLQRQSWELELLITGFSIFLLLKTPAALNRLSAVLVRELGDSVAGFAVFPLQVLEMTVGVLIFNLVIHVVLRGIWIGFVGLSSVFPEGIRFERLGYRPSFVQALRRRVLDQRRAIVLIDQVSSTVFSFSFLIAGYVLSATIGFSVLILILAFSVAMEEKHSWLSGLSFSVALAWALILVLGLIDFVSAGGLKRWQILERPWSRIHRFLTTVTLSFVYRPIYYVLATNYRRSVVHGTVLAYLATVGWLSWSTGADNFEILAREASTVHRNAYDSLRPDRWPIKHVSIPSPTVSGKFLPVFVNHDFDDTAVFNAVCGALPDSGEKQIQVLGIGIIFAGESSTGVDPDTRSQQALECLRRLYRFRIAGSVYQPELLFHRHPNQREEGLFTWIPIDSVAGQQRLRVETRTGPGDDDWRVVSQIPFLRQP